MNLETNEEQQLEEAALVASSSAVTICPPLSEVPVEDDAPVESIDDWKHELESPPEIARVLPEQDPSIWTVQESPPPPPVKPARSKGISFVFIALVLITFGFTYGGVFAASFQVLGLITSLAWGMFSAAVGLWLLLYPVSILIVLGALYQWLNSFTQADRIHIMEDGLAIGWPLTGFATLLPWRHVTSVYLFCPHHTMMPEKWLVGFGTHKFQPIMIKMGVFEGKNVEMLKVLREKLTWASVDPAIIELWEPAIADSHTELWLKSLEKAPDGERLMPLFPGVHLKSESYCILNRLGVGGQGTAYLAADNRSMKASKPAEEAEPVHVVVKENLFPVYVDSRIRDEAEQRFKKEIELLERLKHPRIVTLLDSFIESHRGYAVLEFIEGKTLRQFVRENGPLDREHTIRLASQMCEILAYLHGLEPAVIHRDFTPENLMFDKDGNLKLIDFNVAREVESTRTATIVGKHCYIPPEQFRGSVDCRSDIYAMGATLHFLLCGEDPQPISQSRPIEKNPHVDADINEIVAKATAVKVDERYQSAAEILHDLRRVSNE